MSIPSPLRPDCWPAGERSEATSRGPIGVFDSGLGGLSVWREIASLLPNEDTLYLADQAHVPYGPRSLDEIRSFSIAIAEFLINQGAKLIVVACNTASGAALHPLRLEFPTLRFVGMEPAVKPAVERTATGVVGVLATPTAFQGELFRRLVDRFGRGVTIHTQICPGLVEAVEAGRLQDLSTRSLLGTCLRPLMDAGVDQLVLGCTHYPFLADVISEIVGPGVALIDPAPAVARQVRRVLVEEGLCRASDHLADHVLCTTGPLPQLASMARQLVNYAGKTEQMFWHDMDILRVRIA